MNRYTIFAIVANSSSNGRDIYIFPQTVPCVGILIGIPAKNNAGRWIGVVCIH